MWTVASPASSRSVFLQDLWDLAVMGERKGGRGICYARLPTVVPASTRDLLCMWHSTTMYGGLCEVVG